MQVLLDTVFFVYTGKHKNRSKGNYLSIQNACSAYTLSEVTPSWNLWAPIRKASGAGLPCFTSGSSPDSTRWWNREKNSLWLTAFMSNDCRVEPVTTAMGTPWPWRCRTSLSAPEMYKNFKFILQFFTNCFRRKIKY